MITYIFLVRADGYKSFDLRFKAFTLNKTKPRQQECKSISIIFQRNIRNSFCYSITTIFQYSLDMGRLLLQWKHKSKQMPFQFSKMAISKLLVTINQCLNVYMYKVC